MPARRRGDDPNSEDWRERKPNGGRDLLYKLIPTVVAALIAGSASYVAVKTEIATLAATLNERTASIRSEVLLRDASRARELDELRGLMRDHLARADRSR